MKNDQIDAWRGDIQFPEIPAVLVNGVDPSGRNPLLHEYAQRIIGISADRAATLITERCIETERFGPSEDNGVAWESPNPTSLAGRLLD